MFLLYIISGILAYAHKIPILGRIVTLLSLWYGRTTWWKLLIKIRKTFIILNALIGVLMVYKTVGFGFDNILAGFVGMGHTYLEIVTNMTKKLFNWFVELFDQKIVPNVPNNSGSGGLGRKVFHNPIDKSVWNPISKDILPDFSLRELYKNPTINVNIDTPWYKEWKTWMWILGIAGACYFGYTYIIDPFFIQGTPTVKANSINPSPIDPNLPGDNVSGGIGDHEITLAGKIVDIGKSIGGAIGTIKSKLNPFNWLLASSSAQDVNNQFESFIERQNELVTADRRYYPFTEINPYDSYFNRLRISWLGETSYELSST